MKCKDKNSTNELALDRVYRFMFNEMVEEESDLFFDHYTECDFCYKHVLVVTKLMEVHGESYARDRYERFMAKNKSRRKRLIKARSQRQKLRNKKQTG